MSRYNGMLGKIIIVNGPTGAGKTTYVLHHKKTRDIIIDFDAIRKALTLSPPSYHTERKNNLAIHYSVLIRDLIIRNAVPVVFHGDDLWFITSEPDKKKIYKLFSSVDYIEKEYILLEPSRDVCIEHIEKDETRIDKDFFIKNIDSWFNYKEEDKQNIKDYNNKVVEYYYKIKKDFDELHIDYFFTGSILAIIQKNTSFDRPMSDIDMYLSSRDIKKVKKYCKDNKIKFESCIRDYTKIKNTGHLYYFYPFPDVDFHIGFFIFKRKDDGVLVYNGCSPKENNTIMETNYYKYKGVTGSFFSFCNKRAFPYEYAFVFKLLMGRMKDLKDYEIIRDKLDVNLMLQIKRDYRLGNNTIDYKTIDFISST